MEHSILRLLDQILHFFFYCKPTKFTADWEKITGEKSLKFGTVANIIKSEI